MEAISGGWSPVNGRRLKRPDTRGIDHRQKNGGLDPPLKDRKRQWPYCFRQDEKNIPAPSLTRQNGREKKSDYEN